jgi:hypothetical protein
MGGLRSGIFEWGVGGVRWIEGNELFKLAGDRN